MKRSLQIILIGFVVFSLTGTAFFTYVQTGLRRAAAKVNTSIPLGFQIEVARTEVENLIPDIRDIMHLLASAQVDCDHKGKHIERKTAELDSKRGAILALRSDLNSDRTEFVYGEHSYTAKAVQEDLEKRFQLYKMAENSLESDKKTLTAWQNSMKANQSKLATMLKAKQDLEVQLSQLETRLKTIEASEATKTFSFDNSKLARAKKLIVELNKHLDVREAQASLEGQANQLIPVEDGKESTAASITNRLDEYFGPAADIGS